ncbi:MAG: ABC transporter ATP-binding protein [Microbacteriaceae bacterium]|jgi:oligopeptide transport system ATP-binding protein|nr:ABC transporter ATP-binding protein [Microbacteriaceae bacterium]HQE45903.1 ABC transporter ATP-binding protein [Rhodoglobus sp.]
MTITVPETTSAQRSGSELLSIRDLNIEFFARGKWTRVVSDAALDLKPGGSLALVGESGSGKTVTSLSILQLLPKNISRVTNGSINFDGRDLLKLSEAQMRDVRGGEIGMIFQEPMTSLNPVFTVGDQIAETVRRHRKVSRKEAWARAVEVLDLVGIPAAARRAKDYPHSFSGGMRQRAMIAMAISCEPKLLLADEPTTALDVTVQASVLQLLRQLQDDLGTAVLLVTHDLGVVADFCDDVTVMYAGEPVEVAPVDDLFGRPSHPYSAGLLRSLPQRTPPGEELTAIPGMVPQPDQLPPGCRFAPRCDFALAGVCDVEHPELVQLQGGQLSRCIRIANGDLTAAQLVAAPQGTPAGHDLSTIATDVAEQNGSDR